MRDNDKTLQPLSQELAALRQQVTDLEQQLQRSQTQLQAATAEQQRLAASLQETQIKNRALLQAIPDLIMRLDRTGVYLDFIEAKHIDLLITTDEENYHFVWIKDVDKLFLPSIH